MPKIYILLIGVFACLSLQIRAQDEAPFKADPTYSDGVKYREVIVNTTLLIAQFVPFNASSVSKFNIYDYEYRRLKNGKGWRFSLGVNVNSELNSSEPNNFYLRLGLIKKRQIAAHFHFFRSWDINLSEENFDGSNRSTDKLNYSGVAFSYAPGIEYSINSRMSISTEGILFLGFFPSDSRGANAVKFIPPVGLFFHAKF